MVFTTAKKREWERPKGNELRGKCPKIFGGESPHGETGETKGNDRE
jgi:hypothetical protein